MRRIAVVGIDGSGKSTVIRRFAEVPLVRESGVMVMTCPAYHDTPNAPLAGLSKDLDALSRISDSLVSFELKAVALFLQMTLYGPVERFLAETFQPAFLVSERHALVDSLAYGPFYRDMIRGPLDRSRLEPPLRDRLEAFRSGAYESVLHWAGASGLGVPFWDLASHVRNLFQHPPEELLEELVQRYRTPLPDVVLLLDVSAATAEARVSRRSAGATELHERTAILDKIRRSYQAVLDLLSTRRAELVTRVIRTGEERSVEKTLGDMLAAIHFER